jgi:hypothetical protein
MSFLPQILLLAIALFVAGLLDNVFSKANPLSDTSSSDWKAILATVILCSLIVGAAFWFLGWVSFLSTLDPDGLWPKSFFQEAISSSLHAVVRSLIDWVNGIILPLQGYKPQIPNKYRKFRVTPSSMDDVNQLFAYNEILMKTYDDVLMHDALKALDNLDSSFGDSVLPGVIHSGVNALVCLFSSEGSARSAMMAANLIISEYLAYLCKTESKGTSALIESERMAVSLKKKHRNKLANALIISMRSHSFFNGHFPPFWHHPCTRALILMTSDSIVHPDFSKDIDVKEHCARLIWSKR